MVFGTALSGIQASTKELEVIGNNVANSSTNGFKSSRAEFVDVYSAGAFGGGSNTVGSGVKLSRVQQSFTQGQISFTNNALDMGINGGGFFILSDNGARSYSRAGAFNVSTDGYIETSTHKRLQGLLADDSGNVTNTQGDLKINQQNIQPRATSEVKMGINLYAKSEAKTFDWSGGANPALNTYNDVTSLTVYDSLGNSHILSMYFIKSNNDAVNQTDPNASTPVGTSNQWYVAFQIDNQNVPANVGTNNTDNLYRVNFNNDGTFKEARDVGNTVLAGNIIPVSYNLTNGADPLTIGVDLTTMTQFGSPFAVQSNEQDGYTTGQLDTLEIDDSGVILGRYTNGRAKAMGQLQLANFSNLNGLQPTGDSNWVETSASGQPIVSKPGSAGLGYIQSGALEDSNVDLTAELVKLITAQRNFQANAQTIKTADSVTQTIINIR